MKRPESNELTAAADLILKTLDEVYDDPIVATVKIKCPECNGAGTVQHWLWQRFFDVELPDIAPEDDIDEAVRGFWSSHGYDEDQIPPEEHDCDVCGGTGRAKKTIGLSDLFRELIEREVKKEISDDE